ncbi:hypothetical protein BH24ACT5_BH24ACT5_19380 [soil metagenome]
MTEEGSAHDPVLARRDQFRRLVNAALRTGYALLFVAVVLFFVAWTQEFSAPMPTLVTVALVASFVLLAPAIVFGYAVRAADRADRERSW